MHKVVILAFICCQLLIIHKGKTQAATADTPSAIDSILDCVQYLRYENPAACVKLAEKLLENPYLTERQKADLQYIKGEQLYVNGQLEEAKAFADTWKTQLNPLLHAHQNLLLGMIEFHSNYQQSTIKRFELARQTYREYNHPNIVRTLSLMGICKTLVSDYEQSIALLEKALAYSDQYPGNIYHYQTMLNYGVALIRKIQNDTIDQQSLTKLDKIIPTIEKHYKGVHCMKDWTRGSVLRLQYWQYLPAPKEEMDQKIKSIDDRISTIDNDYLLSLYHYNLANLFNKAPYHNYSKAYQHINKAIALGNTDFSTTLRLLIASHHQKAKILYNLKQYEDILETNQHLDSLITLMRIKSQQYQNREQLLESQLQDENINNQLQQERSSFLSRIGIIIGIALAISVGLLLSIALLVRRNKRKNRKIFELNEKMRAQIKVINAKNQELQHTNDALKELSYRKEKLINRLKRFASITVHELKEPIRTISSFQGLLQMVISEEQKSTCDHALKKLNQNTQTLKYLIEVLSIFNNNTLSILDEFKPVNINNTLTHSLDKYKNALAESQMNLHLSIDDQLEIIAQENLISHLYNSIIEHILKTRRRTLGGDLKITDRIKDRYYSMYFEYTSNRSSISFNENAMYLFSTKNVNKPGLAPQIELAICKEIMDFHDGRITIELQKNKRTTIRLIFPIENKQKETATDTQYALLA